MSERADLIKMCDELSHKIEELKDSDDFDSTRKTDLLKKRKRLIVRRLKDEMNHRYCYPAYPVRQGASRQGAQGGQGVTGSMQGHDVILKITNAMKGLDQSDPKFKRLEASLAQTKRLMEAETERNRKYKARRAMIAP